jgi:flagellar basal body-associated protein FliL
MDENDDREAISMKKILTSFLITILIVSILVGAVALLSWMLSSDIGEHFLAAITITTVIAILWGLIHSAIYPPGK